MIIIAPSGGGCDPDPILKMFAVMLLIGVVIAIIVATILHGTAWMPEWITNLIGQYEQL